MASVNELLRQVLDAHGDIGVDLTDPIGLRAKRELLKVFTLRIPQFLDSHLRQGNRSLTIADPLGLTAEDATGEYAWPADAVDLEEPIILTNVDELDVKPCWYSNPKDFWAGGKFTDATLGTPERVLVRKRTLLFRPIPNPAQGPWSLVLYGNFYPDAPTDSDPDGIPTEQVDAVVSGSVVFLAKMEGEKEIAAEFTPLWESALRNIRSASLGSHTTQPMRAMDF